MWQFLFNGLSLGLVYSLVTLGFSLIYYSTKTFHIAHGAVYAFSAYLLLFLESSLHLPLIPAIILTIFAGMLLGTGIEFFLYRPLRDNALDIEKNSNKILVSSIGAYIVIVNLIAIVFGNEPQTFRLENPTSFEFFSSVLTTTQILQIVYSAITLLTFFLIFKSTLIGNRINALMDDSELVAVLGYDVLKIRLYVFLIGSGLASLGAILYGFDLRFDPYIGFDTVLIAAVASILGGPSRLLAPAIGAILLGLLQGLISWQIASKWANAGVFMILILMLLIRRKGLFDFVKRAEEL